MNVHNEARWQSRFWSRIDASGDCWIWTGKVMATGYGSVSRMNRSVRVHRLVWELLIGPIPDGMQVDHLCRNRICVNPAHLDIVTHQENVRRGLSGVRYSQRTHCPYGHPYSGDNLRLMPRKNGGVNRHCKTCEKAGRNRGVLPSPTDPAFIDHPADERYEPDPIDQYKSWTDAGWTEAELREAFSA